jgi:hypothetical protein
MKKQLIGFVDFPFGIFLIGHHLPLLHVLLVLSRPAPQFLGLVQRIYLFVYLLHLLPLLLLLQSGQLQHSQSLVLLLLLLSLSQFVLSGRQSHDVVVEIEPPLLLSLRVFVHHDFLEGLRELEDPIFGESDREEVPLVFPARGELELQDVLQLDSGLGDHVLQFIEI